jgi:hypothetical protein
MKQENKLLIEKRSREIIVRLKEYGFKMSYTTGTSSCLRIIHISLTKDKVQLDEGYQDIHIYYIDRKGVFSMTEATIEKWNNFIASHDNTHLLNLACEELDALINS